jgi:hypothetical protein
MDYRALDDSLNPNCIDAQALPAMHPEIQEIIKEEYAKHIQEYGYQPNVDWWCNDIKTMVAEVLSVFRERKTAVTIQDALTYVAGAMRKAQSHGISPFAIVDDKVCPMRNESIKEGIT